MSEHLIMGHRSRFLLLSVMAAVLLMLLVPAASWAEGGDPNPPVQDPTTNGDESVAPADDPTITDGVAPEEDTLTKLEILLLTLLATF